MLQAAVNPAEDWPGFLLGENRGAGMADMIFARFARRPFWIAMTVICHSMTDSFFYLSCLSDCF
jgi:hypothetical protein